jgi:hypothetical protein
MKAKVVFNYCYGGFGLSDEALDLYEKYSGKLFCDYSTPRHDPTLVRVVEELGKNASGVCANLLIEEIEGDMYRITECDGLEQVETPSYTEWVKVS